MEEQVQDVWRWVGRWALVYALNLPLTVLYALDARGGAGSRPGAVAATVVLWAAWAVGGAVFPQVRRPLAVGGVVTAVAQLVPCGHLAVWLLAAWTVGAAVGDVAAWGPLAVGLATFAVVLTAGQLLVLASLAVGWYAGRYGIVRPPSRPARGGGGTDTTRGG
jgi:hypothetical protein